MEPVAVEEKVRAAVAGGSSRSATVTVLAAVPSARDADGGDGADDETDDDEIHDETADDETDERLRADDTADDEAGDGADDGAGDGAGDEADDEAGDGAAATVWQPPADGEPGYERARRRLRASVLVEILVVLVVLALSSTLAQTTPARAAQEDAARQNTSRYTVTLTSNLYTLAIDLDSRQVGANNLHLYAYTPNGGASLPVQEWTATAALPSRGIDGVPVAILPVTPDHAIATATLPTPGTWQIRITLRTTDIDEATVVARIPIS